MLNVLFLAAEAEPFIKVGGLGDVAGSLPRYLRRLSAETTGGIDVDARLVLPLHPVLKTDTHALRPLLAFPLPHENGAYRVQVLAANYEGLPVYFLDGEPVSSSGSVYSSDSRLDGEKYTFFPLAALELTRLLGWRPHVVHANDWHSALACYAIWLRRREGEFASVKSVLTVHNLPFMGPDVSAALSAYGMPLVRTGLPDWAAGRPLALGLWAADAIVAVSPSYASEIQTPEFGCGLEQYLSARRETLHGILNGIDDESFNPALDAALAANYGIPTLERRAQNKTALRVRLHLHGEADAPILGVVSRLDLQKGIDLIGQALRRLRAATWQAAILGTGTPKLEASVRKLQDEFPDRVRAETRYDDGLARQIYAGADIFLMPSRYEPCGLAQMIAMRYGCVPIVSRIGGLKDTVVDNGTGFCIEKATGARLATGIRRALAVFSDNARWRAIQEAGMSQNFSWSSSAERYFGLYQRCLAQEPLRI